MFGTFLHIIRNDRILGLYRGVCAHLHYSLIHLLTRSTTALRIPLAPINLLNHPLRRLRGAKIDLRHRQHLAILPLSYRHGLHLRLLRWRGRKPR